MFKATGDPFYLEILCPNWDRNRLFLKELFLEEAHFNAYI